MKAMTLRLLAVLVMMTSFGAIGCSSHDHDDHDRRSDRDYRDRDYHDRNYPDHGGDRR